jgi:phosphoglycolate phosphatase
LQEHLPLVPPRRAPLTLPASPCYKPLVQGAPFALYVFDLDGTLVDSRTDLAHAVNAARDAMGLSPLGVEEIQGYVGEGASRLLERSLGPAHVHRLAEALDLFCAHYRAHLLDSTRAYEGVADLLAELGRLGAEKVVVSNKPEEFSRAVLRGLGLADHFSAVLGGDTLPERKPSAVPIRHVMGAAGVARDATLVVGDSGIDVRAARSAEVRVCAVTYGFTSRASLTALEPDFFADRPADVLRARPR